VGAVLADLGIFVVPDMFESHKTDHEAIAT